jgi:dTDP-4-dehydrorhamnose 3,5-epimerase
MNVDEPTLITGGLHTDHRGTVYFNNDLDLSDIKRVYYLSNHEAGYIRAWHGHKKESKIFTCISGACRIALGKLVESENHINGTMLDENNLMTFDLNSKTPQSLIVPAGWYNGFRNYTSDTLVQVMSDLTVEESHGDDYRIDYDYLDSKLVDIWGKHTKKR